MQVTKTRDSYGNTERKKEIMQTVRAICISKKKGTPKQPVKGPVMLIKDYGIEGDGHAGSGHRQVSLLAWERIEEFRKQGAPVKYGSFGENIIIEGIDLRKVKTGQALSIGDVVLVVTQIGKECHDSCIIGRTMGRCIMPEEGVFARVEKGGVIKAGDNISI